MNDERSIAKGMSPVERAMALRGADAFRAVPVDQLARLAAVSREQDLPPGTVLFREGDPPGGLVVIIEGTVHLERGGAAAGAAEAGETLGAWSLFDEHPRRATAVASTPCRVLVLERDDFYDVLSEHIEIVRSLCQDLVRRLLQVAAPDGETR